MQNVEQCDLQLNGKAHNVVSLEQHSGNDATNQSLLQNAPENSNINCIQIEIRYDDIKSNRNTDVQNQACFENDGETNNESCKINFDKKSTHNTQTTPGVNRNIKVKTQSGEGRNDLNDDDTQTLEDTLVQTQSGEEEKRNICSQALEDTKEIRPNSEQIRPNSDKMGPNSEKIRPNSEQIHPNSEQIRPNSTNLIENYFRKSLTAIRGFYKWNLLTHPLFVIYVITWAVGCTNYVNHYIYIPPRAAEIGIDKERVSILLSIVGKGRCLIE